jgi:ADP-heptose:LPS heptosyltransferase
MVTERPGILVIRGGAIGDFILTLPALAALRAQFPQARLTVLGYPHIAQLAVAGGLADEVRPIEARGLAGFFNPRAAPPAELADFFAGFAVIVSYLYDPDAVFQQSVRRCTRATYIAGPHRPDETQARHATDVFLKPLERLAIFEADPVPRLHLAAGAATPPFSRPRLAVHPGSGSERKNWPESRWAELLKHLAGRADLELLLVGGEAEGDRLQRLARLWPADRLTLAQSLPLTELARRLAGCAAFAGHDSGITHLAAALGLAGVALWGDSSEAVWRPRGNRLRRLRHEHGLAALPVGEVADALDDLLAVAEGAQPRQAAPGVRLDETKV